MSGSGALADPCTERCCTWEARSLIGWTSVSGEADAIREKSLSSGGDVVARIGSGILLERSGSLRDACGWLEGRVPFAWGALLMNIGRVGCTLLVCLEEVPFVCVCELGLSLAFWPETASGA